MIVPADDLQSHLPHPAQFFPELGQFAGALPKAARVPPWRHGRTPLTSSRLGMNLPIVQAIVVLRPSKKPPLMAKGSTSEYGSSGDHDKAQPS
jgi:hypothetical protein